MNETNEDIVNRMKEHINFSVISSLMELNSFTLLTSIKFTFQYFPISGLSASVLIVFLLSILYEAIKGTYFTFSLFK